LLNGFKRYRCARKLRLATVAVCLAGVRRGGGILSLLRTSNNRALSILSRPVSSRELKHARQMSVAQIAAELSRSKSLGKHAPGLIAEMSAPVRRQLFAGAFPVYSYMYALRQFMRMNGVKPAQIEEFVLAVSGKGLACGGGATGPRLLPGARVLSPGNPQGNLALPLERMRHVPQSLPTGATSLSGSCSATWTDPEVYCSG